MILRGKDAREALMAGIDTVADTVKITLGPQARTVVYRAPTGAPIVINDGVSIVNQIKLKDSFQDLGASLMRQEAGEAQKASGDGTTTATIMAQAMSRKAMRLIEEGALPQEIKKQMDMVLPEVMEWLNEQSNEVDPDSPLLEDVAVISANNDEELGQLIANAFAELGEKGVVMVEENHSPETTLTFLEGMELLTGSITPLLMNNKSEVVIHNPYVLTTDLRISQLQELIPTLEMCVKEKRPLVVFCADMHQMAIQNLVLNVVQGNVDCMVLPLPGVGSDSTDHALDVSVKVGSKLFLSELGERLEDVQHEHLGEAKTITVRDEQCIIVADTATESMARHVSFLEKCANEADHPWTVEKFENRIARLEGKVALIKTHALTQAELFEKKARMDDAINATRAALKSGYVCGGGLTQYHAAGFIEQNYGGQVITAGLEAPLLQLAENAGITLDLDAVRNGEWFGFNSATLQYENLKSAGIIDPTLVVKNSIQAAASITGLLLTTDALVIADDDNDN